MDGYSGRNNDMTSTVGENLSEDEGTQYQLLAYQLFGKPVQDCSTNYHYKGPFVSMRGQKIVDAKKDRMPRREKHGPVLGRCLICYSFIYQDNPNGVPKSKSLVLSEFLKFHATRMNILDQKFSDLGADTTVSFDKAIDQLSADPNHSFLCDICGSVCAQISSKQKTIFRLQQQILELHQKCVAAIQLSAALAEKHSKLTELHCDDKAADNLTSVSLQLKTVRKIRECLLKGRTRKRTKLLPTCTNLPVVVKKEIESEPLVDWEFSEPVDVSKGLECDEIIHPQFHPIDTEIKIDNSASNSFGKIDQDHQSPIAFKMGQKERTPSTCFSDKGSLYLPDDSISSQKSTSSDDDDDANDKRNFLSRRKRFRSKNWKTKHQKTVDTNKQNENKLSREQIKPEPIAESCGPPATCVQESDEELSSLSSYSDSDNASDILPDDSDDLQQKEALLTEKTLNGEHRQREPGKKKASNRRSGYKRRKRWKEVNGKHYYGDTEMIRNSEGKYLCPFGCRKFQYGQRAVGVHIRNFHSDLSNAHKCDQCGSKFRYMYCLQDHIKCKHEGGYECDICKAKLSSRDNLNRHKRQVHEGIPGHVCEHCGKVFKMRNDLTRHLVIHTGEKPYICEVCDQRFSQKASLAKHLRTMHGAGPRKQYQCEICHKYTNSEAALKDHKRVKHESGTRASYKCEHCDKTFKTSSHLNGHVRTHTGERPYHCRECPKSFTLKSHLVMHVGTHTGEKPYACFICGLRFSQTSALKRHRQTVHGAGKKYQCNICRISLCTSQEALQRHKQLRHGVILNSI